MYIDPSAGALMLQLAISAGVGLLLLFRRSFHQIRQLLLRDVSRGFTGLLIASSFANLALLRIWTELFGFSEFDTFEMKGPPPWTHFAGALLDFAIIALLVWPIVRKMSNRGPWGKGTSAAFLILCAVPLNAVRECYFPALHFGAVRAFGPIMVLVAGVVCIVAATVAIVWYGRPISRVLSLLLLAVSPFMPITIGRTFRKAIHPPAAFSARDEATAHHGRGRTTGSRVVWLLFDEMDQRITFEDRPAGLRMPEFDRLRSTSIYADAIHEAGPDTNPAIPSLLTGRTVLRARELGTSHFGFTFEDSSKEFDSAETSDLFGRAGAMGFSSGVVGWGMPYCRLFGAALDRCWWCESVRYDNSIRANLAGATIDGLRSLVEARNFSPFGQSICLRQHIQFLTDLTGEAIKLAVDRNVDLVFLHLHGAHPPHVYDRSKKDFSLTNSPIRGYTDSLALCDLTLGRIRSAMEQQGLWDGATVLVGSDHHSRSGEVFDGKIDHRSIFLLKMAGEVQGAVFNRPASAVVSGDLLLEILQGRVKNAREATVWLDARSQLPSERM